MVEEVRGWATRPGALAIFSMVGSATPSWLGGTFSESTCTSLTVRGGTLSSISLIPGIGEVTAVPAAVVDVVAFAGCT
jgi:hypothetical protein